MRPRSDTRRGRKRVSGRGKSRCGREEEDREKRKSFLWSFFSDVFGPTEEMSCLRLPDDFRVAIDGRAGGFKKCLGKESKEISTSPLLTSGRFASSAFSLPVVSPSSSCCRAQGSPKERQRKKENTRRCV